MKNKINSEKRRKRLLSYLIISRNIEENRIKLYLNNEKNLYFMR